jgi:hypothetical protein
VFLHGKYALCGVVVVDYVAIGIDHNVSVLGVIDSDDYEALAGAMAKARTLQ